MPGVSGATSAPHVAAVAGSGGARSVKSVAPPDLMPEPNQPAASGYVDAMSSIYALMSQLDATNASAARESVKDETNEKKTALKKEEDARAAQKKKEEDAKNDGGGFWGALGSIAGTIADVGCVVGSVALAVVSGGALAPVAVAALSVTSFTLKETHAYDEMGGFGRCLEAGLTIGTGVCGGFSNGGGLIASAIDGGAAVAGGTAGIADAVVTTEVHDDEADAENDAADALAAKHEAAKKQREIEDVIAALKETHASCQHALASLESAMTQRGQTMVAITSATGRA